MSVDRRSCATARSGDVEVQVEESGGALHLHLFRRGVPLVRAARLGLTVDGKRLGRDSRITAVEATEGRDQYRARTGKAVGVRRVEYHEARLRIEETDGPAWGVVVRASGGGVALRYVLPDGDSVEWESEDTTIPLDRDARAWLLDYQPWYETPRFGADVSDLEAGDYGLPVLVRHPSGQWLLLSESAIDARFSGAHVRFSSEPAPGFVIAPAGPSRTPGGSATPWRSFAMGDLGDIVASTLVDDLAPPADEALEQAEWIRPGHAAWSWWSDFASPSSLTQQMRFTEYAARQGWEHILVDAGWSADWLPELIAFAGERNVQVHVWSHWNRILGPEGLRRLALWKSWGVAGVKLDFMESESQERYLWYDAIIAETARLELMVNFHGSVIPRGWARTFPHVMSYEAIRGAEWYKLAGANPTAAHNVIQAFTRNVVGSMDYTPVTFSASDRDTSEAHELALSVVFECGITHFADDVAEYESRPLVDRFLRELPPSWDETRLLSGTPDTEVVLARRSGDRWFVGCIASGPAHVVPLDLGALRPGGVDAGWLVGDDGLGGLREIPFAGVAIEDPARPVAVPVGRNGGFVAVVGTCRWASAEDPRPASTAVVPPRISVVPEAVAGAVLQVDAPGADALRVPPGWGASPVSAGTWVVRVPIRPDPAPSHVLTAETRRPGGAPLVAHARVRVSDRE